jgi:hypothetical protein
MNMKLDIQHLLVLATVIFIYQVPECFLNANPVKNIDEMILTETNNVVNFILACTPNYNVMRFICTLRSARLNASEIKPVILMIERLPTKKEFHWLRMFPKLFIFIGSPAKRSHLEQVGVTRADKVVVFNQKGDADRKSSYSESEFKTDGSTMYFTLELE